MARRDVLITILVILAIIALVVYLFDFNPGSAQALAQKWA